MKLQTETALNVATNSYLLNEYFLTLPKTLVIEYHSPSKRMIQLLSNEVIGMESENHLIVKMNPNDERMIQILKEHESHIISIKAVEPKITYSNNLIDDYKLELIHFFDDSTNNVLKKAVIDFLEAHDLSFKFLAYSGTARILMKVQSIDKETVNVLSTLPIYRIEPMPRVVRGF